MKVSLLGPERAKNFELVLGKLKMPYEKIAEALIACDDKILTLTNLDSLEIIAPTDEEVGLIKSYDGDKSLLGNSEKFIDEISKAKGFLSRIKGIKFSKVNDEMFADLEPKVIFIAISSVRPMKCSRSLKISPKIKAYMLSWSTAWRWVIT